MRVIKVIGKDQRTGEGVAQFFDWHEVSGRLSEVTSESAYAAGICEVEGEAIRHAVDLCDKHGLNVLSYQSWERWGHDCHQGQMPRREC